MQVSISDARRSPRPRLLSAPISQGQKSQAGLATRLTDRNVLLAGQEMPYLSDDDAPYLLVGAVEPYRHRWGPDDRTLRHADQWRGRQRRA